MKKTNKTTTEIIFALHLLAARSLLKFATNTMVVLILRNIANIFSVCNQNIVFMMHPIKQFQLDIWTNLIVNGESNDVIIDISWHMIDTATFRCARYMKNCTLDNSLELKNCGIYTHIGIIFETRNWL